MNVSAKFYNRNANDDPTVWWALLHYVDLTYVHLTCCMLDGSMARVRVRFRLGFAFL